MGARGVEHVLMVSSAFVGRKGGEQYLNFVRREMVVGPKGTQAGEAWGGVD